MRSICGKYEVPKFFRDEWEVRWKTISANYRLKYDDYVGKFTFKTRKYTGQYLVDLIKSESGEDARVLDVGCGINPFKEHFKNIIGVDPGDWGNADMQMDLNQAYNLFYPHSFDWILSIGYLHHMNEHEMHIAIEQIKELCAYNGKMACLINPVNNGGHKLYPMDRETIDILTAQHGLQYFMEPVLDYTDVSKIPENVVLQEKPQNNKIRTRLFWIWQKENSMMQMRLDDGLDLVGLRR